MKTLLLCLTISTLGLALPSNPLAGSLDDAHFAFHIVSPNKGCDGNPVAKGIGCEDFTGDWAVGTPAYVYVVLATAQVGVGGVSFGLSYDHTPGSGVDVFSWTTCADGLDFPSPSWPDSGGGNRITWITCQTTILGGWGVHAVPGFLYVNAYSDDFLQVTSENEYNELRATDCLANGSDLYSGILLNGAGFGELIGWNRCDYGDCFGCSLNPNGSRTVCCLSDDTFHDLSCIPNQNFICEDLGGILMSFPCSEPIECNQPVPIGDSTWGTLKTRYTEEESRPRERFTSP